MDLITDILSLEVTQYCNLDCKFCSQGANHYVFMNETVIRNVFKEVKAVRTLVLTGGEVFLAYETIRQILAIAIEMNVFIYSCEITTNGCIYDPRIYDLLDEAFGQNYKILISLDDFHDKSIKRIYENRKNISGNPSLNPCSLDDVMQNMKKHMENPHFSSYKTLGNKITDVGRAKNIDYLSKHEYFVAGYFYDIYKNHMLVGPVLFVDANGFIGDGDGEIECREKESLGNVCHDSIYSSVLHGGMKKDFNTILEFYSFCQRRLYEHYHLEGETYRIENKEMKLVPYTKDDAYQEEVANFQSFLNKQRKGEDLLKLTFAYDFSNYPKDLSIIDHQIVP